MPSQSPIFLLIPLLLAVSVEGVGVNWGTAASHPLPPQKVVELLKANNIGKVKLLDSDPLVLESLSGSNIHVTVGIPNSMLRSLNSSMKAANSWVHDNLTRFVSDGASRVLIDYVAVGDEPFLQSYGVQFHPFVVGAAANIQAALLKANLAEKVKVVIPTSFDAFTSDSTLPSKAQFRPDVNKTMIQLLTFLNRHRSPFFVSIPIFQTYHENKNITLDSALFRKTPRSKNNTHNKTHKNLFDSNYNTIVSALSTSGFPQTEIVISKIGWPTDGAANATSSLAQEFTKGLIDHLQTLSTKPSKPTEIYILSLLDEDNRSLASGNFERHWGVFTFDGQAKYQVDLGQGSSRQLANAQGVQYLLPRWCVVNNNKELLNTSGLASDACAAADCTDLGPGGSCFNLSWPGNISYAFNSYYQLHDQNGASCDFAGLGLITTVDPSVGTCRFSIGLRTSGSISLHKFAVLCGMMAPMISVFLLLISL